MITRKQFLLGTAGLAIATASSAAMPLRSKRKRPNVLYIMADEWRAQAFAHMGDPNAHTPAFDRFHGEAVSFSQAVSGTPVCCPARASLMTGQYPLTNGVYINDVPLKPTHATLGEAFANANYHTGYIGKWHLHGSPDGHYGRRLAYIPPDKRFGFHYWKVCECTHDYNHSLYYADDDPTPRYWKGYDAIAQTDDALNFIRNHQDKDDPYFLVLSWGPPHFFYSAPEAYNRMYENRDIVLRPNVPPADREKALQELRGYYAAIAVLNDCFARLMAGLEKLGAEDTIVVFTSDHGEMAFSQGLDHKLYPWEESVRVPFMLRYPRRFGRKPTQIEAMFNSPDIMPTLLGVAGVQVPDGLQGHDYSHLLHGRDDATAPKSAFLSMPVPITTAQTYGIGAYRGVRTNRYTYVRSLQGPWLLYDNLRDPYQMRNLVGHQSLSDVQRHLDGELESWLRRLDDQFLPPEVYLERDHLTQYFETKFPVGVYESPWGDWRSTLKAPPEQGRSIDTTLHDLLANPATAAVVHAVVPGLATQLQTRGGLSPRAIAVFVPESITRIQLNELEKELSKVPKN